MKLLTRRVGFRHVKEHKFKDAANPLIAVKALLNQEKTFFCTALTFLIEDWLLLTKSKILTRKSVPHNPISSFWKENFHNRFFINIRSNNSVFNIFRKIWLTVVLITRYSITLNCIYFRTNIFELISITPTCLELLLKFFILVSQDIFFLLFHSS